VTTELLRLVEEPDAERGVDEGRPPNAGTPSASRSLTAAGELLARYDSGALTAKGLIELAGPLLEAIRALAGDPSVPAELRARAIEVGAEVVARVTEAADQADGRRAKVWVKVLGMVALLLGAGLIGRRPKK
jgi:hypothetical protein